MCWTEIAVSYLIDSQTRGDFHQQSRCFPSKEFFKIHVFSRKARSAVVAIYGNRLGAIPTN